MESSAVLDKRQYKKGKKKNVAATINNASRNSTQKVPYVQIVDIPHYVKKLFISQF